MEEYYDMNFDSYEISQNQNFLSERIWNVVFDQTYDQIYVFRAKMEQVKKSQLIKFEEEENSEEGAVSRRVKLRVKNTNLRSKSFLRSSKEASPRYLGLFNRTPSSKSRNTKSKHIFTDSQGSHEDEDSISDEQLERKILQVYENTTVALEVVLQIWSIDDRVINDKDHKKLPISEHQIFTKTFDIPERTTLSEQMDICQNRYGDYAQLIQNGNKIHAFFNENQILTYEIQERSFKTNKYTVHNDGSEEVHRSFQNALHFKEIGKRNQFAESLLQFSYIQFDKKRINGKNSESRGSTKQKKSNIFKALEETVAQAFKNKQKQKIQVRMFDYSQTTLEKNFPFKVKEFSCPIEDDLIRDYYSQNEKQQRSFFLQRIHDSTTYILLFPTGLLMHVCFNPMQIQAKIQLNIKKDETILDIMYCLDDAQHNHCIWLLDEKHQVWKCVNEYNPNSCNWTLHKITMLDSQCFMRFFKPAMSYSEHYETNVLNNIACMQPIFNSDNSSNYDYIFACNQSSTKAVIICQPRLQHVGPDENDQDSEGHTSEGSVDYQLLKRFKIDKGQLETFRTSIIAICKNQHIILNRLPEKKDLESLSNRRRKRVSIRARDFKFRILNDMKRASSQKVVDNEELKDYIKVNNEIFDIIYSGKVHRNQIKGSSFMLLDQVNQPLANRTATLRQFIIRRKRSVEVLFTNGLYHWIEYILGAEVNPPMIISGMCLSKDNTELTVQFSPQSDLGTTSVKIFKRAADGMYKLVEGHPNIGRRDMNNLAYDFEANLCEYSVRINMMYNKSNTPLDSIYIERRYNLSRIVIPEFIFFKDLFPSQLPFQRMIISQDRRIILSEKVLIQLNEKLTEVKQVACIVYFRDEDTFKAKSLLKKADRKNLQAQSKINPSSILHFREQQVLFPKNNFDFFYVCFPHEEPQEETSVLKIQISTLRCQEIYRSKAKITHVDMLYVPSTINTPKLQTSTSISPQKPSNAMARRSIQSDILDVNNSASVTPGNPNTSIPQPPPLRRRELQRKSRLAFSNVGGVSQSINHSADLINSSNVNQSNPRVMKQTHGWNRLTSQKPAVLEGQIFISLVSQKKSQINVEILVDTVSQSHQGQNTSAIVLSSIGLSDGARPELLRTKTMESPAKRKSHIHFLTSRLTFTGSNNQGSDDEEETQTSVVSSMDYLVSIWSKQELQTLSQAMWITRDKLLVTLNNDFYLLNLKHQDLVNAKSLFSFGSQQVHLGLYCSIFKVKDRKEALDMTSLSQKEKSMSKSKLELLSSSRVNQQLLQASECVSRVEMANLRKYLYLRSSKSIHNKRMKLLFFTPAEELYGGNLFSKLSSNYKIIQPFLEIIDGNFITLMNREVQNILMFSDPKFTYINNQKIMFDLGQDPRQITEHKVLEGTMQNSSSTDLIHMYQADIFGHNAIDYAFQKNAIYCIKAFVETLMILNDEVQFRNCFNKALLMMIKRSINVKQLVNSELFYPTLWKKYSLFSSNKDYVRIPYNNDLNDLEYEDPYTLFKDYDENEQEEDISDDLKQGSRLSGFGTLRRRTINFHRKNSISSEIYSNIMGKEQFEMQYNYIFMAEIEGQDKLDVMRTLKDCEDIKIFEQESIQNIIDYKWDTYGRFYFLLKFFMYMIFLLVYYWDLEGIDGEAKRGEPNRVKDIQYYVAKVICSAIQLFFINYEIKQMKIDGSEYFADTWNYYELSGNAFFFWGTYLDITSHTVDDFNKVVFTASIIFTLIKVVYLVRVFRQLNFLVTMFITVVSDMKYFLILFGIFTLTFAEGFHLLNVDITPYGRTPEIVAHVIAVIRCAMGDFAMVDMKEGFDLMRDPNAEGDDKYKNSYLIMITTFILFIVCVFYMFMIFMNFIIAVIGESYSKVIQNKEAFDYQQRAMMIYEREVHFEKKQILDQTYFPKIIVIRKMKQTESIVQNNFSSMLTHLQKVLKNHAGRYSELLTIRTAEQKQYFSNSIKVLENDIHNQNREIDKILQIVQRQQYANVNQNTLDFMREGTNQSPRSESETSSVTSPKGSSFGNPTRQIMILQSDLEQQQHAIKSEEMSHIQIPMPTLNETMDHLEQKSPTSRIPLRKDSQCLKKTYTNPTVDKPLEPSVFVGLTPPNIPEHAAPPESPNLRDSNRDETGLESASIRQLRNMMERKMEVLSSENQELKLMLLRVQDMLKEQTTRSVEQSRPSKEVTLSVMEPDKFRPSSKQGSPGGFISFSHKEDVHRIDKEDLSKEVANEVKAVLEKELGSALEGFKAEVEQQLTKIAEAKKEQPDPQPDIELTEKVAEAAALKAVEVAVAKAAEKAAQHEAQTTAAQSHVASSTKLQIAQQASSSPPAESSQLIQEQPVAHQQLPLQQPQPAILPQQEYLGPLQAPQPYQGAQVPAQHLAGNPPVVPLTTASSVHHLLPNDLQRAPTALHPQRTVANPASIPQQQQALAEAFNSRNNFSNLQQVLNQDTHLTAAIQQEISDLDRAMDPRSHSSNFINLHSYPSPLTSNLPIIGSMLPNGQVIHHQLPIVNTHMLKKRVQKMKNPKNLGGRKKGKVHDYRKTSIERFGNSLSSESPHSLQQRSQDRNEEARQKCFSMGGGKQTQSFLPHVSTDNINNYLLSQGSVGSRDQLSPREVVQSEEMKEDNIMKSHPQFRAYPEGDNELTPKQQALLGTRFHLPMSSSESRQMTVGSPMSSASILNKQILNQRIPSTSNRPQFASRGPSGGGVLSQRTASKVYKDASNQHKSNLKMTLVNLDQSKEILRKQAKKQLNLDLQSTDLRKSPPPGRK